MRQAEPGNDTPGTQLLRACAELETCLRAGEACGAERWLTALPGLAADTDLVVELIYAEFKTREELGRQLPPGEWAARFPQWWERLRRLFLIDDLLGQGTEPARTFSPPGCPPGDEPRTMGGSYLLLERIGQGGMGVVYKANQVSLRRVVALKVLRAGALATAHDLARFHTEAEAVARLRHPNIVQVFEAGERDGQRYLALEYMEGGDLRRKLAGSPLPAASAAALLEPLARAVHHAHEAGIIHRDLKPANVLLDADGIPKVTDFGLAKRVDESAGLTGSDHPLGTPSYMAPEQAQSQSAEIGPHTDVYALGAILYECLTGRAPFLGATPMETMMQVVQVESVPPRRLVAAVPRDLETICLKCLEKDPAKRYPRANDLADDLRRFLVGRPVQARPVSAWERGAKWTRRRPALAALLIVVVMGITVGLPLILGLWSKEKEARTNAELSLYSKRVALARLHWTRLTFAEARQELEACPPALRDREWHYLWRVCGDEARGFDKQSGSLQSLAFSPDGRHLVTVTTDSTLRICDLESRHMKLTRKALDSKNRCRTNLVFAPGGQELVVAFTPYASGPMMGLLPEKVVPVTLKRWDAASGRQLVDFSFPWRYVRATALSRDGSRLAIGGRGILEVIDTATGKPRFRFEQPKVHFGGLAFSGDNRLLASAGNDRTVRVWDVETQSPRAKLNAGGQDFDLLVFHPDGRRLVGTPANYAPEAATFHCWDLTTGKELLRWRGHEDRVTQLAIRPDGKLLATASRDRTVIVWDVETGREYLTFRGHTHHVTCLAFSPDGHRLAAGSHDGVVKVWDTSPWEPEGE